MKNRQFIFIIALVILSIAASYLHRILVVNRDTERKYSLPVITDTVIPATGPMTTFTKF